MGSKGIEMDQILAQRLLVEGATLVMLDVPVGTEFGIDLKSWNTVDCFKGIKMIPPGFHYVHYSAVDEFGEATPKVGFFHIFKKSEFLVKRWDAKEEDLSSETIEEETVERYKSNLKDLDRFLGCYPYDIWKQWKELTNHITPPLVERCSPICGFVRSALELEYCTDAARPRGGESSSKRRRRSGITIEEKEDELLPDMKPKPGTELRLSKIPCKQYPDGASPTEITKYSLDTSYALDTVLKKLTLPIEIIGEMELAFVCFLVGQSFDAFEHWKKLVSLICGADCAISQRRAIYIEFMKALEVQLMHVPEDILCDIVANNNFVYHNLRKLFANIEMNSELDGRLKSYTTRFSGRLSIKFLWDFSNLQEETEDEAPVVVSIE
ncbi:protein AAR2 homolog [Bombus pascuorum]|uniref:protein AAR2 homolog n=1 Tax=Bombus pascuorum TaxID=65598 RepID=UPI0021356911|nr:protein AAR2 homolog [Bombus pascuorum]XP_060831318.1 protein AAR2 homolog [Bombus pascuorum]XP_060831319.1 protein AAR2 homolog [Bombus pascuorum]XP_060831321.1 protein AAR2 homolog [Bombus pascuorum]